MYANCMPPTAMQRYSDTKLSSALGSPKSHYGFVAGTKGRLMKLASPGVCHIRSVAFS
jgi:hypothetical protein